MSERGFTDLAVESAAAFRVIMNAMARPGRIQALEPHIEAPAPLGAAAAAVALTLCDFQTPVYLAPSFKVAAVERYLRFHTGAAIVVQPDAAAFAFMTADTALADLPQLAAGTHEYPDRSATAVIQVAGLTASGPVDLDGPGIKGSLSIGAEGLDFAVWQILAANHAQFPLGFDVIFVSHNAVAGLPRSTAIRIKETV